MPCKGLRSGLDPESKKRNAQCGVVQDCKERRLLSKALDGACQQVLSRRAAALGRRAARENAVLDTAELRSRSGIPRGESRRADRYERARPNERGFMRSVRSTLGRLDIALNAGKGRWLALTSEAAVADEMKERNGCAGPSVATLPTKSETVGETPKDVDDDNVRLIALPSAKRRAPARVTKV